MKQLIIFSVFFSFFTYQINAQECEAYIPIEKGKKYMFVSKNKKGKIQSYHSQELLRSYNKDGGVNFEILHINYDKKKEIIQEDTLIFMCKNNQFIIDMTRYLNEQQLSAYDESDITITFENLSYPSGLKPGTELKDGYVQAEINAGVPMTFKTEIKNRKVEAFEEIITEAGSFKTLRVSEDMISQMSFMNINMSSKSWIKMNVGTIKTESYDKNGNLLSVTELISIE
jgi:hypothetical protein